MVRDAVRRAQKYERKIDADAIRLRFEAQREFMVQQQNVMLSLLTALEEDIKAIVEDPPAGVTTYTYELPFYLSSGREMFGKARRFTGKALVDEIQLIVNKWNSRGLDCEILKKIAALFGVTITTCYPSVY